MLKLRKVELLGFKSFCEKTKITFSGNGITCIVGPNGCGKSNVVDAISWVLGEQSHKMLRAERMADCIFNGTAKRPPLGLAEVTLTLEDPELAEAAARVLGRDETPTEHPVATASEEPPLEISEGFPEAEISPNPRVRKAARKTSLVNRPGEVIIGRRLYRSGQCEYLLNGRVARLRDIQELFMGIGLGPDSYAIIEQGRIGQILSSKPMDRRSIIEEAAGVTVYKSKRRLAEARLEASKANLARVNDILTEVDKQLGSLKRQANKARRYAELRDELRGRQRRLFGNKARLLAAEAAELGASLQQAASLEEAMSRELHTRESEQERLSARTYELDGELRRLQNLASQCALEMDRAENRAAFDREQITQTEARQGRLTLESREADARVHLQATERTERSAEAESLRQQSEMLEVKLQNLLASVAESAARRASLEAKLEELRLEAAHLAEQATRSQVESEQARTNHDRLNAEHERRRILLAEAAAAVTARSERAAEEMAAMAVAEESLQNARAQREAGLAKAAALRKDVPEAARRAEICREDLAGAQAHCRSIEQILNERAYSAEAVQRLFNSNGRGEATGFRAVGLLADYAEVAPEYEAAVEQFLHDELEYIVVETFDHARAGISLLRDEMGGRATFFVDSLRNLNLQGTELAAAPAFEGVVDRLDCLVSFRDPLGPAAKHFLPKLRSAFLVESAARAEELARTNVESYYLTPDGTCYHGRMVSGGRPGDAGPLALKRELRQRMSDAAQLEGQARIAREEMTRLEQALRLAQEENDQLQFVHLEAEKKMVAARHQAEQAQAEISRLTLEHNAREAECRQMAEEAAAALRCAEDAANMYTQACQEKLRTEQLSEQMEQRLAEIRAGSQTQQEEAGTMRAEAAKLAERHAAAQEVAARLVEEGAAAEQRSRELMEELKALGQQKAELEANAAEQTQQAEKMLAEKQRLEAQKALLEAEWDAARKRSAELEEILRGLRQSLDEKRARRNQLEVDRARNGADLGHLRDTCRTELSSEPEALAEEIAVPLAPEEVAAAEAEYAGLHEKLESMGPINMMALDEYRECEERNTFLTRERDDLVQSIENTQQGICELDEISREKFDQAFAAINQHFAEAFRTLFGGGTGEMRLTEPDASGDSGVDIAAQPPGKRLQNILLLSGGEKALTALALLIAVFRYRPSPFCILDEVDAPLDEANVGRFNDMLAQMGEHAQFIIITHNRRTMGMGEVLYGVTMQEPGVSRIVSVRWDKEKQAARTNAA